MFRTPLGWTELIDEIRDELSEIDATDMSIDNEQYHKIRQIKQIAERLISACDGWKSSADMEAEAERLVMRSASQKQADKREYQADWMTERE